MAATPDVEVTLENVVANVADDLREETLGGRKYLVAPVTLIVPGVLNGSEGPGLYPPEEVGASPHDWNHFPIVKGHPTLNGKPVTARDPAVLENVGLGFLYRTQYNNRLHSEAWFDEEYTKAKAPDTYQKLLNRDKVEVSTGLFLTKTPAPEGAVYNKTPYTFVTSKYRPDHLAVIEDGVGACSCEDGCGVFNKAGTGLSDVLPTVLEAVYNDSSLDVMPTVNPYPNEHAARIQSPDTFEKDSFRRKQLAPGISAIMAKHKEAGSMMIQSYRFDKRKFTAEQAKSWLKKHHVKDMGFEPATQEGDGGKGPPAKGNPPVSNGTPTNNELDHDAVRCQIQDQLKGRFTQSQPYAYVEYVFDDYFIYYQDGGLYRLDYEKSDTAVTISSEDPVEVVRKVSFLTEPMENNMAAMTTNQRDQIVTELVSNCDCWKKDAEGSKKVLNGMTDEQLVALHQQAKAEKRRLEVEDAARKGFGLPDNATSEQVVNALKSHKPAPPTNPDKVTVVTDPKAQTNNESRLTPEEKEAVEWANNERTRVKGELVARLTANVAEGAYKARAQTVYQTMSIENLRALADAQPAPAYNADPNGLPQIPMPMFVGAQGAPPATNQNQGGGEPLESDDYDLTENASPKLKERARANA